MGREGTPDGRRMGRPPTTGDATMASGVASAAGNGNGTGVRLRRGSTSYDEHRNSFSSIASLNAANSMYGNANANGSPSAAFRRRSSNFSDYSQDARDLLNPKPLGEPSESLRHHQPTSSWDTLPLAFALLPAMGGLLVQGGGSFVTDLMLLCLGGIFLHWSVTQPWTWYHSSQQIREEHETNAEFAVQSESDEEAEDDDDERARSLSPQPLENLEEEEEGEDGKDEHNQDSDGTEKAEKNEDEKKKKQLTPDERVAAYNKKQREKRRQERRAYQTRQEAALRELYRHEVLALLSCFAFPVLGAFLLHALRSQLTRPSEGLISDFNLTVFILAAEVRPLRHFLQLVQARTLHLQRIVHANPYREEEEQYRERRAQEEQEQNQVLSELLGRFESLEQQTMAASAAAAAATATVAAASTSKAPPNPHHNLSSPSTATSYFSSTPTSPPSPPSTSPKPLRRSPSESKRDRDQLVREVRAQLQPELDTLARALRRTHKQQTMLETQVVAKFRATDQRLNDAVSLASAAASGGRSGRGRLFGSSSPSPSSVHLLDVVWTTALWASEAAMVALLYLPRRFTAVVASAVTFPLWIMQTILGGWSGGSSSETGERRHREGNNSRRAAASPSSAPIFVVDGHLTSGKATGIDSKPIRDLDYEYATISSSGMRQSRMGLAA
ncbi:hypothetical protein SBRCBS47491_005229 [Sporothrix bragantina]|uniref:Uncharacterized protein n=1 Tax=Sporothrix bragantina TaxID=671064 RepID=A0ABP0BUW9_9PEZI